MACPSILNPMNQCIHTGLEEAYPCKALAGLPGVSSYTDHAGRIRLTYRDQAGLLLEPEGSTKRYIVAMVYTQPEARRNGLARSLFFVARRVMGLSIYWDSHLSEDGEALRASVG